MPTQQQEHVGLSRSCGILCQNINFTGSKGCCLHCCCPTGPRPGTLPGHSWLCTCIVLLMLGPQLLICSLLPFATCQMDSLSLATAPSVREQAWPNQTVCMLRELPLSAAHHMPALSLKQLCFKGVKAIRF